MDAAASRMTPTELKLRGQAGGNKSWAQTVDRQARMAKPTAASPAELEWHAQRLDPNNELPERERYKRAENARKAYFASLALKSATAARKRREARESGRSTA